MYAKRFWLCLFLGFIAGIICAWTGYSQTPEEIRTMASLQVVLNRALIGFLIGISAWKMSWAAHGIVLGLIGTLPLSVPLIVTPQAGFGIFVMYTLAGAVWGFLIELVTSVVFKAKQGGTPAPAEAPAVES
jgi:hypothetical protein